MSLGAKAAVMMVLNRNLTNGAFTFFGAQSVSVEISSGDHAKRARCSATCLQYWAHAPAGSQAREASIFELLHTQCQS